MKKVRKRRYKGPDDLASDLLLTDPELKRLGRRMKRQEKGLAEALGSSNYTLYLDIEETHNERCFALARRVWDVARAVGLSEGRRRAAKGTKRG